MGAVYTKTSDGKDLRRLLREEERGHLMTAYYDEHHKRLEQMVDEAIEAHKASLIVDCHSFPSIPLPCDQNQEVPRPDFCIGTDAYHTPPALVDMLLGAIRKEGFTVKVNKPYAGTMVPMNRYRRDARVQSVMIEVNRKLYLHEGAGEKTKGFEQTRCLVAGLLHLMQQ